jgi:hypothetical protein
VISGRDGKCKISLELDDAKFGIEVFVERGRVLEFDERGEGHGFGVEVTDADLFAGIVLLRLLSRLFIFVPRRTFSLRILCIVFGLFPAA